MPQSRPDLSLKGGGKCYAAFSAGKVNKARLEYLQRVPAHDFVGHIVILVEDARGT